jgi:hypothetical protein
MAKRSFLPFKVAVCYGIGKDLIAAKADAARNALSYLKVVAKRKSSNVDNCGDSNPGKKASEQKVKEEGTPRPITRGFHSANEKLVHKIQKTLFSSKLTKCPTSYSVKLHQWPML